MKVIEIAGDDAGLDPVPVEQKTVDAKAVLASARAHMCRGDIIRAIELLTDIVKTSPNRDAILLLADCFQMLDEREEAATLRDLCARMPAYAA